MSASITPTTQVLEDSFVYSCSFDHQRGYEQFLPHHILSFQISGETHIQHQNGLLILKENQMVLSRRNQLAKTKKIPAQDQAYKSISVLLSDEVLRKFAVEANLKVSKKYTGNPLLLIEPDALLKSYFQSLLPYVEESRPINQKLAALKLNEAIELLLNLNPALRNFLFDFSAPYKIALEKFMLQNYHYNVPIAQFAILSGRSLAAFKRDFQQVFQVSPRKWLQEKRLLEAHDLLQQKKRKPTEIYLELGFENLSHFYTAFKQKFGITPANIQ